MRQVYRVVVGPRRRLTDEPTAGLVLRAFIHCCRAPRAGPRPDAVVRADTLSAKLGAGCKTPLDLVASQMPNLPMHPGEDRGTNGEGVCVPCKRDGPPRSPSGPRRARAVFQEILNSPSLKGTLFVPTARAWDNFFATVRSRQGNPEAPAMVARYGQVVLYHLAQDVSVPIATPTPGTNKFAL
jgi:hypothetical protein